LEIGGDSMFSVSYDRMLICGELRGLFIVESKVKYVIDIIIKIKENICNNPFIIFNKAKYVGETIF